MATDLIFDETALPCLDPQAYAEGFNERIVGAYQKGNASAMLPADAGSAQGLIPPGTAALRDFSYIAPEIPVFDANRCVGCMACVTQCPDTAILAKVIPESAVAARLAEVEDKSERFRAAAHWAVTN